MYWRSLQLGEVFYSGELSLHFRLLTSTQCHLSMLLIDMTLPSSEEHWPYLHSLINLDSTKCRHPRRHSLAPMLFQLTKEVRIITCSTHPANYNMILGCFFGAILGLFIAEKWGRRATLLGASLLFCLGAGLMLGATNRWDIQSSILSRLYNLYQLQVLGSFMPAVLLEASEWALCLLLLVSPRFCAVFLLDTEFLQHFTLPRYLLPAFEDAWLDSTRPCYRSEV